MSEQPYTFLANILESSPATPSNSIVSQTIYQDKQSRTILFNFAPGQELSEHTSAQNAILYFIAGEADLTLGADKMAAQAGTWVHMPPHLPHSIVAKTPVTMLLQMTKPA
jgi:quercetin dioxygenase-like cupin family protein